MAFTGSEDFIRMQFEEYILALLSSVKYSTYVERHADDAILLAEVDGDPSADFGVDWVHHWKTTENYRIFEKFTGRNHSSLSIPEAGPAMANDVTIQRTISSMSSLRATSTPAHVRMRISRKGLTS